MVEGEAEIDMASLDPKRYGSWMTTEFAARKNEECYDHVYILHHPDEERPTARPLRTSPAYDRQAARGAQFGWAGGWERPNYYAPQGFSDHDSRSFRRGAWWQYAVDEAKAVRESAGLIDATLQELDQILYAGTTSLSSLNESYASLLTRMSAYVGLFKTLGGGWSANLTNKETAKE